ncbi:unnamed protein product, partial [Brachionus calyciflorus]
MPKLKRKGQEQKYREAKKRKVKASFKEKDKVYRKLKRQNESVNKEFLYNWNPDEKKYFEFLKDTPRHICCSCGCLYFRYSVKVYEKNLITKIKNIEFIEKNCKLFEKNNPLILCNSCNSYLYKKNIPPLNLNNGIISSRAHAFINTGPKEERIHIIKPKEELEELNEDSNEIYMEDFISHYTKRPNSLKDLCLAEFVADYDIFKKNDLRKNCLKIGKDYNAKKRGQKKILRYVRYSLEDNPENYYREQILLFVPFFNEENDVINIDHKNIYKNKIDIIIKNKKKFGAEAIDFEKIEAEYLTDFKDNQLKNDELNIEDQTDLIDVNFQNPKSEFKPTSFNKCQIIETPQQVCFEEYSKLISCLNNKQYRYLMNFMSLFKNNEKIFHFVTGGAGVGKSTLIKAIFQSILRYNNSIEGNIPSNLKVVLCAPTGKAAFLIEGLTLHHAFKLPINSFSYSELSSDIANTLRSSFIDMRLLIIDEISLVGSNLFNLLNRRLQQIFQTKELFGGLNILTFGDYNQLRPVKDKYIFETCSNDPYSKFYGNLLWKKFQIYELTEIMQCENHNNFKFSSNKNEEIICFAIDSVKGEKNKEGLEEIKKVDKSKTFGLMTRLLLKCSIRYLFVLNVDVSDGLVNGSTGILKEVEFDRFKIPHKIWIEFDSNRVGKNRRKNFPSVNKPESWTPIDRESRDCLIKNYVIVRRQFPIIPAEAITITKSQGSTYDKITVGLNSRLTRNEIYVAFSRVTSFTNLHTEGSFVLPKAPEHPTKVQKEIQRMKEEAQLNLKLKFLEDYSPSDIKIAVFNVQSLNKHYRNILNDYFFKSCDFFSLLETWTLKKDDYFFPGFTCIQRDDCPKNRKAFGSIAFVKNTFKDKIKFFLSENDIIDNDQKLFLSAFKINDVTLISIYKSPKYSSSSLLFRLRNIFLSINFNGNFKLIICGDFNIDINKPESISLVNFLELYGLKFSLELNTNSTNKNTQIDLCFSNLTQLKIGYFENLFSYHKPIWISLDEKCFYKNSRPLRSKSETILEKKEPILYFSSTDNELFKFSKTNQSKKTLISKKKTPNIENEGAKTYSPTDILYKFKEYISFDNNNYRYMVDFESIVQIIEQYNSVLDKFEDDVRKLEPLIYNEHN